MGLRSGVSGDFIVADTGDDVAKGVLPAGVYTHLLSSRLNGALRSPYLPKDKKFLSVRIMGGGLAARRTVIDNCAIGENYKVLENESPSWVKLETYSAQQRLPVFMELVTRWDNPRIPDRPQMLKPHQLKLLDSPRSYFGIAGAVLHDVDAPPRESVAHMLRLFAGEPPSNWRALAQRYREAIALAINSWSAGKATDDDARWLDWMVRQNLLTNRSDRSPRLQQLISEYRALEATIGEPRVVEGLTDAGAGRDYPVLIGGNPGSPGDPAPRRFLKHVLGEKPFESSGSGRRELAEAIADRQNPLTARVMVNRVWQYIFGRGIVSSVDNFGVIGDAPSHPELLDYLAAEFVNQGWSTKKLIRTLVLSQTFRQSGEATTRARELDPQNALLSHYPLRRLEAESIRDSLLLASGELKDLMFGPSIHPYREKAKEYRRLFSGPLDGEDRRSIYLKVTRMEGTSFLETFDYPNPMATRGSRDMTNVPAQALTLLNDPFVVAEAEQCARRILEQKAASVEERLQAMFRTALGRRPTSAELERFRGLAGELASLQGVPRGELLDSPKVWQGVAHTVFNLKEFIYIQ
jgi:hypothetical protein